TLRGRELQERVHPDEPRRRRRGEEGVRAVLRGALRRDRREASGRGRHRIFVGRAIVRSMSDARALARRHPDPRRRRARARREGTISNANAKLAIDFDVRPPKEGEAGWYIPSVNTWGFTLTRLHARYRKDALGEDLVFKETGGVLGGREDFGAKDQRHDAQA